MVDFLIVIVNNDRQVKLKGADIILRDKDRKIIMENLKSVDIAIIAKDYDQTVCDTLKIIINNFKKVRKERIGWLKYRFFFINHSGSVPKKIAEEDVCRKLGIELLFVGGKKRMSSSVMRNKIKK